MKKRGDPDCPLRPHSPADLLPLLRKAQRALDRGQVSAEALVQAFERAGFRPEHPWAIKAGLVHDAAVEAREWLGELSGLTLGNLPVPPNPIRPGHKVAIDEPAA